MTRSLDSCRVRGTLFLGYIAFHARGQNGSGREPDATRHGYTLAGGTPLHWHYAARRPRRGPGVWAVCGGRARWRLTAPPSRPALGIAVTFGRLDWTWQRLGPDGPPPTCGGPARLLTALLKSLLLTSPASCYNGATLLALRS